MKVRMGLVALALAVFPLVLRAPAVAAETLREQSEVTLDAARVRGLEVENARGLIEVRPGAPGRIHVRALKVVRAEDRAAAARIAKELRVEVSDAGDRKVIRVRYPQRQQVRVGILDMLRGDLEFPRSEVRFTIEIPERLPVWLKSTSGDVRTEDLAGLQTLESVSGDVTADGAKGPVTARTTSGDIAGSFSAPSRLRSVSGDVSVEWAAAALEATSTSGDLTVGEAADSLVLGSVSGDIVVERAPRGVRASSTSGDLRIHAVAGVCDLQTASGDLDVWLGRGLRAARIESGSGNIEARVVPGLGVAIEVRTSNGNIVSDLGMQVKSASRRQLSGSLGTGTVPVRLSSSSGDIQITSGGE